MVLTPYYVNLTASQTYTLVVTDNASGCSSSDQMQVNVTGGIFGVTASSSSSVICEGDSVEIQALASGGSGSYSYLWNSTPDSQRIGLSQALLLLTPFLPQTDLAIAQVLL